MLSAATPLSRVPGCGSVGRGEAELRRGTSSDVATSAPPLVALPRAPLRRSGARSVQAKAGSEDSAPEPGPRTLGSRRGRRASGAGAGEPARGSPSPAVPSQAPAPAQEGAGTAAGAGAAPGAAREEEASAQAQAPGARGPVQAQAGQASLAPAALPVPEERSADGAAEGPEAGARAGARRSLVVCVGEPVLEFVPGVRPSVRQAVDDVFATWRSMQWAPPEFARAPGATSCQVSAALGRMGVPVAFVGRVGADAAGHHVLSQLHEHGVATQGVIVAPGLPTAVAHFPLPALSPALSSSLAASPPLPSGPLSLEPVRGSPGPVPTPLVDTPSVRSLLSQAAWVHCTALSLAEAPAAVGAAEDVEDCIHLALHPNWTRAPALQADQAAAGGVWSPEVLPRDEDGRGGAQWGGGGGARLFLDANLPLPLWRSREAAWRALDSVWGLASVVELSRAEAEFLLGEEPYARRRDARRRYAAESYAQLRSVWDEYHYSRGEVAPLWERAPNGRLELLLITDGTVHVHYYTAEFDGSVDGTEDVLVAALTCDRAGSGDAVVAGVMRKLMDEPGILRSQDRLERAIRFAISAGVISQWTTGAVRSFPTAEATQNLTEQMFLSTLV